MYGTDARGFGLYIAFSAVLLLHHTEPPHVTLRILAPLLAGMLLLYSVVGLVRGRVYRHTLVWCLLWTLIVAAAAFGDLAFKDSMGALFFLGMGWLGLCAGATFAELASRCDRPIVDGALQASVVTFLMVSYAFIAVWGMGTRAEAIYRDANFFALTAALALLLTYSDGVGGRSRKIVRVLLIGVVALSQSITGALCIAMVLLWRMYEQSRNPYIRGRTPRDVAKLLPVGMVVVAGAVILAGDRFARILAFLSGSEDLPADSSVVRRWGMLNEGLDMIARNPWVGVGFGNARAEGGTAALHNTYLELLASGGLVITALVVVIAGALIAATWPRVNTARSRMFAVGAVLVLAFAVNFTVYHRFGPTFLLGFFWAMCYGSGQHPDHRDNGARSQRVIRGTGDTAWVAGARTMGRAPDEGSVKG